MRVFACDNSDKKTFLVQSGHFLICSATVEKFQHLSLWASRLTSQLEPHCSILQ